MPRLTDKFSKSFNVSAVLITGDVVDITFSEAHGLVAGGQITINNAYVDTIISSWMYSNGVIMATTSTDHDLTSNWQEKVTIKSSTNTVINGTHELLSVPNRRHFTFKYSDSVPRFSTGNAVLVENIEDNPFNDRHSITSASEFTIRINIANNSYSTIDYASIKVSSDINISGGSNLDRVMDIYESQKPIEPWLFVVLDDLDTGKARSSPLDSMQNTANLNAWNIEQIASFSIYFFEPSGSEISGRASRDEAEKLRTHLYKVMINARFNTGLVGGYPMSNVCPVRDGMVDHTTSFYIHQYQWQQIQQVSGSDVGNFTSTRAFRNLDMQRLKSFDVKIMENNINLDEVPL